MNTLLRSALITALALGATAANAEGWFLRSGFVNTNPKSDNGSVANGAIDVSIDSNSQIGLIVGKFIDDRWAVELLAATPFDHTASLNGVDAVDFTHLPPTLSLQYHFNPQGKVHPFIGAGVNYTLIYNEGNERGPVAGADVGFDNSWGLAAQAGLRFEVNERWDVVFDARWIDIDTKVKLNGVKIGTASVDPIVMGLNVGYNF